MKLRKTSLVLAGVLAFGGVSACSQAEQDQVEQQVEDGGEQVEDGANDLGDEVQEQVEEGAEEGAGG